MHLQSVSNFRAIAIILIVAGHTLSLGFMSEDFFSSAIKKILTGNTSLFVFISGFMFHYVFYHKYQYKKFMVNKLKVIGVPYFILSTLSIAYAFYVNTGYFDITDSITNMKAYYPNGILGRIFSPSDSSVVTILKYYFVGAPITAYWYIPFALILFALSPFHIVFIKLSTKYQLIYTLIFVVISLITYRPEFRNPLLSILYFTPLYLIGILSSIHKDKILSVLKPNLIMILVVYVNLIFLLNYFGFAGSAGKEFFDVVGVDFTFIEKTLLIMLLWAGLEKYNFNSKLINTVSETSFAIFFIHGWILHVFYIVKNRILSVEKLEFIQTNNYLVMYFSSVLLIIFISVTISLFVKKLFRYSKRTRYLIGY